MISINPVPSSSQFRKLASIIMADTGIVLSETKKSLLVARLNRRLRALRLNCYGDYCVLLDSPSGNYERRHLISAITTNVTAFFREDHHFRALAAEVFPRLAEVARNGGRVRLWSAACSTGEEPYSLGIALLEVFPEALQHDVLILATDIDPAVVALARAGRFSADAVKSLDENRRKQFFTHEEDCHCACDKLRKLLRFEELNLHDPWPFSGQFDVIFCRNVAIYFGLEARRTLWSRFAALLPSHGELCIGHSERIDGPAMAMFNIAGPTRYRRNSVSDSVLNLQGTATCP